MKYRVYAFSLFFLLGQGAVLAVGSSDDSKAEPAEVVVLLHGLGRSNTAMWRLAGRLEEAGFDVQRIGYSSLKTTPVEMLAMVTDQINDCCAEEKRVVHFAGHSLGGLLIRAYLQTYRPPVLGNTVLIGTPNGGTELADRFKDHGLIQYFLPTARQLGTDPESLPNSLPPPDYTVGIIAGVVDSDLVERFLPGPSDGMVPVDSARLEGMLDFIEVDTSHSMMRYDEEVASEVIHFLQNGRFSRE